MTDIMKEDMEYIAATDYIPWNQLAGKSILITGATGLVGYNIVCSLLYVNENKALGMHIIALVRNEKRAFERFSEWDSHIGIDLMFVVGTVEKLPTMDFQIDYIIHGASQTSSKAFIQQPVETIEIALLGTMNLLQLARNKDVDGFLYLSSMEVYGSPERGHKVVETETGTFSPLDLRNSYPLSKILCENLCHAYSKEYGIRVKIIRLTQTFGPGVNYNDSRVFAYFGRCVAEKTDIVLKTKGDTERCYLYTRDAVTAILTTLLKGDNGEVYNAADESTYCSIAEMAYKIAEDAGIQVKFDIQPTESNGYPNTLYMDLDTTKLKSLGWDVGGVQIVEMIYRMLSLEMKRSENIKIRRADSL